MEMVYVVNKNSSGSGSSGSSGSSSAGTSAASSTGSTPASVELGYRLVDGVVSGGALVLEDRCVTSLELATADPVKVVFPSKREGVARDFLLRLLITSADTPEVTFAAPTGETISFDMAADETFACKTGINVFAFTETAEGCFAANRKLVSIAKAVYFDPDGGSIDEPVRTYIVGDKYGTLPTTERRGYTYLGWFTEDNRRVYTNTKVSVDVSRLTAHWDVYVDKYAPAILRSGEAFFTPGGTTGWIVVEDVDGHDRAARSGAIGDNQTSSLFMEVEGTGTLSFSWKASSEEKYDVCQLIIDGTYLNSISGETAWTDVVRELTKEGKHTIEWRYRKDGATAVGSDCVWLDDVRWEVG